MRYHADMLLSTCLLLVVAVFIVVAWRGTSPPSTAQRGDAFAGASGGHHPQALPSPPEAQVESPERPAARQAVEPEVPVTFPTIPPPGPRVSILDQRTDDLAVYVRKDLPRALRTEVDAMDEATLETFLAGAHACIQRYNQRRDEYWARVPQMTTEEFTNDASLELAQVRLVEELRDLIE